MFKACWLCIILWSSRVKLLTSFILLPAVQAPSYLGLMREQNNFSLCFCNYTNFRLIWFFVSLLGFFVFCWWLPILLHGGGCGYVYIWTRLFDSLEMSWPADSWLSPESKEANLLGGYCWTVGIAFTLAMYLCFLHTYLSSCTPFEFS